MADINTMLNAAYDAYEKVKAENATLRKRVAEFEAMFKEQAAAKKEANPPQAKIADLLKEQEERKSE